MFYNFFYSIRILIKHPVFMVVLQFIARMNDYRRQLIQ